MKTETFRLMVNFEADGAFERMKPLTLLGNGYFAQAVWDLEYEIDPDVGSVDTPAVATEMRLIKASPVEMDLYDGDEGLKLIKTFGPNDGLSLFPEANAWDVAWEQLIKAYDGSVEDMAIEHELFLDENIVG